MPMDEKRLTEALRAAVPDESMPPASFDHADVVRASRRVTARRRAALAAGGLAVLAVVGVGVAVLPGSAGDSGLPSAAPAAAPQAPPAAAPQAPPAAAPQAADGAPGVAAENAREAAAAPLGPATGECADRQDPALRALVEQALPEVVGATEAAVTLECRPGGERGVALHVDDAGVVGLLTVDYLPPGTALRTPDPDTVSTTAATASGGTVTVTVRSDEPGALPPFAQRVDELAGFLAPRL
jgi:hypothetical protein